MDRPPRIRERLNPLGPKEVRRAQLVSNLAPVAAVCRLIKQELVIADLEDLLCEPTNADVSDAHERGVVDTAVYGSGTGVSS